MDEHPVDDHPVDEHPVDELRLDCTGMLCPRPIIELGKHLGDVAVGGTIVVVADDPAAALDVPAWCRMRGQQFVGTRDGETAPAYVVRRVS
ncbi:MAG TPA: sulfurtransferase TusA family protein [Marmoricola sp.]|nr:sulfurtransferase TusA family protein [Marmoricola sp.]